MMRCGWGQFPRESGDSFYRGASGEIARVRKHPSPSPRRGFRKGRGVCMGTNSIAKRNIHNAGGDV